MGRRRLGLLSLLMRCCIIRAFDKGWGAASWEPRLAMLSTILILIVCDVCVFAIGVRCLVGNKQQVL